MLLTTKDTKNNKVEGANMVAVTDVSRVVVDSAFKIHKALGPGLLESAYEKCLHYELIARGLKVDVQKSIAIKYEDTIIENAFKLDMLVEDELIVELKSVDSLSAVHTAQILTYLKLSGIKTGLLINFNTPLIRDGIKRYSL